VLKQRLLSASILIALVSGSLYLDARVPLAGVAGLWLVPLLLCFALGTAAEIVGLIAHSGRLIVRRDCLIATALITLSACVPMLWPLAHRDYPTNCPVGELGWIVMFAVLALFLILVAEMNRFVNHNQAGMIERTGGAVFVSFYVGLPMALGVAVRLLGEGNWGLAALLTTIAVTKSADTGAYFVGKSIGRHKLVPRLSPGKTREGAIGGIVTATIVAFVCLQWLFPALAEPGSGPSPAPPIPFLAQPLWGAILFGPLLAIVSMIGDLAESLVKRCCDAKDSGSLLPGMGGVWDVTDSLIATIMPAFLCFAIGIGGNV
jgi:phosphatidate cytidylyltransferase